MSQELIQYKKLVNERLSNADLLVSKLVHENAMLKQELENKGEIFESLNTKMQLQASQIAKLNDDINKNTESIEIIKDLFEHMCGIRVHKSYEDDTGLWFDASQGSTKGIMDYKLGFVKARADESSDNGDDNGGTQVIYVPLLKQRTSEELKKLQDQLPDYMFDTLSFPLASLNQFYTKLTRSLNKND